MPARRLVPRLGLAAGLARKLPGVFSVEGDWDAQASRPRAGLLTYHFSTSYQATMAGRAYGGHGKPAVEGARKERHRPTEALSHPMLASARIFVLFTANFDPQILIRSLCAALMLKYNKRKVG